LHPRERGRKERGRRERGRREKEREKEERERGRKVGNTSRKFFFFHSLFSFTHCEVCLGEIPLDKRSLKLSFSFSSALIATSQVAAKNGNTKNKKDVCLCVCESPSLHLSFAQTDTHTHARSLLPTHAHTVHIKKENNINKLCHVINSAKYYKKKREKAIFNISRSKR